MVRLKTRWLLVRLDVPATVRRTTNQVTLESDNPETKSVFPSRKELATSIRQNISEQFGVAGEGMASDLQGMVINDGGGCRLKIRVGRKSQFLSVFHLSLQIAPPYYH